MTNDTETKRYDWVGLLLQGLGMVIVIGIPILLWGINTNSTLSVMANRLDRVERDATDVKTYQVNAATQMLELHKQLATISAQVTDVRDLIKSGNSSVGKR